MSIAMSIVDIAESFATQKKATKVLSITVDIGDFSGVMADSVLFCYDACSKGKITEDLVHMLMSWQPSGFNVFSSPRIQPGEEKAMENLARYIIRASFSQARMTYLAEESKVIYQSKDGKDERVFDALEWLAAICSHVPNKGEQMARYYGHYTNASRGLRQKKKTAPASSSSPSDRGDRDRHKIYVPAL